MLPVAWPWGAFQANNTANNQSALAVAMDAAGDFVVAWQSYRQDGSGYGVYAKHYTAGFQVGNSTGMTIVAEDPYGNVVSNFSGSVVLSDSLGGASFSAVSFTGGLATVTATLDKAGAETITATDSTAAISGTSSSISVTPAAVSQLLVSATPSSGLSAGNTTSVTITAEDQYNNVITNFSDSLTLSDSLGGEFVAVTFNNGVATVTATLDTAGTQTITANDSSAGIFGTSNSVIGYARCARTQLLVSVPPTSVVAAGSEFQVNTYTTGNQAALPVASDSAGDFVVVWQSSAGKMAAAAAFMPSVTPLRGAAQGSEFRVNTYTTGNQVGPAVAMDSAGDFVVAWQSYGEDGSGYGIYAQRYNSAGVGPGERVPGQHLHDRKSRVSPTVAMDSAGDFVVAWESHGEDGSGYGIYAQRYNAPAWPRGASSASTPTRPESDDPVGGDGLGRRFRRRLAERRRGRQRLRHLRAAITTRRACPRERVPRQHVYVGQPAVPSVAMDSTGDFVVAWQSYGEDGSGYGVYAQRTTRPAWPRGANSGSTPTRPGIRLCLGGDGFGGRFRHRLEQLRRGRQRLWRLCPALQPAGVPQGSDSASTPIRPAIRSVAAVAMDSAGDFVVAWDSPGEDGNDYGVYAQRDATLRALTAGTATSVFITAEDHTETS